MTIPDGSAEWRHELVLVGNLSRLNRQVATYITRSLDSDAGRVEPTPPGDEHALGERLVQLGEALQARATHRKRHNNICSPEGVVDNVAAVFISAF